MKFKIWSEIEGVRFAIDEPVVVEAKDKDAARVAFYRGDDMPDDYPLKGPRNPKRIIITGIEEVL
jgi:hypothetical protein